MKFNHKLRGTCAAVYIFNQFKFKTAEKCKLFDVLVSPILHYSSEISALSEGLFLELIHTKFLRRILCVRKSTNLVGLYGELGSLICKVNMLRYWLKLLRSDDQCLSKQVYNYLKHDVNNNITLHGKNWVFQVKTVLNELGLSNLWMNQETLNIALPTIKQRIFDQYKQSWYQNINNSHTPILSF